ncbi:hypothetical protein [Cellulomonas alba]|uniref:Glycosyltransferase RgtA/B/C/D-like domain-containing protein n=1 Tax=Cellulomonas alba TaxID=3053467 RepID=A0ABT7SCD8_9CELL|nr:hypothetical protein [Cellulomonas alba]MDM7853856.1 hypothetical protein [Cellulomonas alba]
MATSAATLESPPRAPATPLASRPSVRAVALACAVLAFAARFARAGGAPGLWAYGGYDDGVYFGAALELVHGRVPYRDFLLLHPPGVVLALAPFAELSHVMSDARALVVARLAYMVLGGVITALVVLVAAPWGRRAAVTAGLLYALLPVATAAEFMTYLEPLGTIAVLAAALLARRAERAHASGWWSFAVGAAVAVAPATKIWGVATVAVVLAWHAWRLGVRAALRALAGAAAAAAVVVGPFAVLGGRSFWRDVVADQLGRTRVPVGPAARLVGLAGLNRTFLPHAALRVLAVLVLAALVSCALVAWRARRGRVWVVLLAVELGVLLLSPSFFLRYTALVAAPLVLVVASAAATIPAVSRAAVAVAAAGALAFALVPPLAHLARPFPAQAVRAVLPTSGCVRADAPGALILLNLMSRELRDGCDVGVDVTGVSYDHRVVERLGHLPRSRNPVYQRQIAGYLGDGSAVVLVRGGADGLDAATLARLHAGGVLVLLPGDVRVLTDPADASRPRGSPRA